MTDQRYVIELGGEPAGLVVAERSGFRFYAAASTFVDFDMRVFRSPGHAETACRDLIARQSLAPANAGIGQSWVAQKLTASAEKPSYRVRER